MKKVYQHELRELVMFTTDGGSAVIREPNLLSSIKLQLYTMSRGTMQ